MTPPQTQGTPLSWAQERMWFLYQFDRTGAAYHLTMARVCRGRLDVEALRWAIDEVVRRHEILRSVFVERGGVPLQVVLPSHRVELPVLPATEAEWRRILREHASRPFDLEAAPALRGVLARLDERHHVLQLTVHHIAADGWSLRVLLHEIVAFYRFFVDGEGTPPAPPALQYGEFAARQRSPEAEEALREHAAYWRRQFRTVPPPLELPADRPRGLVASMHGERVAVHLDGGLRRALADFAKDNGATVFMVLLAGFQVLLARYSGQDDIAVGTPVANRERPELESSIGCFVNTLVLRADLSGRPTVRQCVERARTVCLGAYARQDMPFERLVDEVNPERSASRNPLFQAMFAFQTTPMSDVQVPDVRGLRLEPVAVESTSAQVDLTLAVWRAAEGFDGWAEYSTELFDRATVERMIRHWTRLLREMVADPDCRIDELPMLDAAERREQVEAWNDTRQPFPVERSATEIFEEQALRTPLAVAAVCGERIATYRELNDAADAVAGRLAAAGVGPEGIVAICAARGIELVAAILGAGKCGAAFLPVNPDDPSERLAHALGQSRAAVVLAGAPYVTQAAEAAHGVPVLPLEHAPRERALPRGAARDRPRRGHPRSLAYVIYTSGSTGAPKGAMVERAGMVNHLHAKVRDLGLGPSDVVAQIAPQFFDISVWQIYAPLLVGARTAIVPDEDVRDPAVLLGTLRRERVTVFECVPSLLPPLLAEAARDPAAWALPDLRWLLLTGEAVPPDLCRRWMERYPHVAVLNAYGPTECSDDVTHHRIGAPPGRETVNVPIGRPVANTRLYVLDGFMEPAPRGVAGELWVGGAGVGRGYVHDPRATARAFGPDPFAGGGARLYRTGDRARHRADGTLEFLGRLDFQVKVRGHRVELGEIEAALREVEGIHDAAAAAWSDGSEQTQIVAYVVPVAKAALDAAARDRAAPDVAAPDVAAPDLTAPDLTAPDLAAPDLATLRAAVAARLPAYMVPAAFVALDALPLTATGKLDRRALPPPPRDAATRGYVAPRTPVEAALCSIWARVLNLERVGVEDYFFERGGDSILCLQVIAQARDAGLRFTVQEMLQHQTVAALVAAVRPDERAAAPAVAAPAEGEPFPLTPVQHWFFEQGLRHPSYWNLAVLLDVPSDVDPERLRPVLRALVAHHDALRLRFRYEGGAWTQQYAPADDALAGIVRLEANDTASLEQQMAALQASLDIGSGPLLRAAWLDRPGADPRLLLVVHHLVADGVSWRVLLQDLQALWSQAREGRPLQLPPRTSAYGHWARWLAESAGSAALGELPYWEALRESGQPLRRDRAGENLAASASTVRVLLPAGETGTLLARERQHRIEALVAAALLRAIAPWNGTPAVLVDVEGHGRDDLGSGLDLTRTVGWFTTLYPVLLQTTGKGPDEDVRAVSERLRSVPSGGARYGILRYLHPEGARRLGGGTAPEVLLNYLGRFDTVLRDRGWRAVRESTGPLRSPRDLRSHLWEIRSYVEQGELHVEWAFSQSIHDAATIRALADRAIDELREMAGRPAAPARPTPADFPLARLSQAQLDRLASRRSRVAPAPR